MSNFDDFRVVVLGILALIGTGLLLWRKASKTATDVAGDSWERRRFTDAIEDAAKARAEAHEVNNRMMPMQRRMGELEAENKECHRRNDELSDRVKRLEERLDFLTKRKTFTRTDVGASDT